MTLDAIKNLDLSFNAPAKKELSEEEVLHSMLVIARTTNQQWGDMDKEDGYNCPICRNKGEIYKVFRTPDDAVYKYYYTATVPCKCIEKRQGYQRSRMSGLPEGYTFDTFKAREPWQEDMKRLCERYLNDRAFKDGHWLYIGGAIGSGKSHIVSALARELVFERNVVYMNWVRDSRQMKAIVNDDIDYSARLYRLTNADILFVDDFLKNKYPTEAEKRLAYDILNERYNNHKPTLFTSELYLEELDAVDEAIASRIYERAREYNLMLDRDKGKDMRRR